MEPLRSVTAIIRLSSLTNLQIIEVSQLRELSGLEDVNLLFGPTEATGRSALNQDRHLDHERDSLAITAADAVTPNGIPPWNWKYNSANGEDNHSSYVGRVILVKFGEYSRKIGIDGTSESIKEAIKAAFGLRTRRAFWLEDEDEVVRSLDRDMPLGTYTVHLDDDLYLGVYASWSKVYFWGYG